MELKDFLAVGRRWLWLFALSAGVGAVGAWVGTRFVPETFASSTTVMVGRVLDEADVNSQTIYLAGQLATTYSQMVTREPVLQGVVDALDLPVEWPQLKSMIKAAPQPGTPMFEIRVVATNPELAQALAAETARQIQAQTKPKQLLAQQQDDDFLNQQIDQLRNNIQTATLELEQLQGDLDTATSARQISEIQSRMEGKQEQLNEWQQRYTELRNALLGGQANALSVIEEASKGVRVGPNVLMNVLFAALLGFGLALMGVLVIEYLDDTVKDPDVIERRLGLPGLSAVGFLEDVTRRAEGLVTVNSPRSPVAEVFRTLRTNLDFALLNKESGPLVITSAGPAEGKSTVAANLAAVFAQAGRSVILVDGDLRKPSQHRFFDLTNNLGFTNLVLNQTLEPESALRDAPGVPGLRLLTSGPLPPNPSEVLGSARARAVLARIGELADVVIIDSPPSLLVTDAAILGSTAAGTMLVFDAHTTRVDTARKAVEALQKAGVQPLGAVVNKLDPSRTSGYYYYSYAGYGGYGGKAYGDYFDGADGEGGGSGSASSGRGADQPSGRPLGWRQRLAQTLSSLLS